MIHPGQPQISVIFTCPHGCHNSAGALARIREQLLPEDELIVVEYGKCADSESGIDHVASVTQDDNQMTIAGLASAHHDVVLVLEDHAIIGPKFIEALRTAFTDSEVEVATFFVENGTPVGVGSKALFTFMYGFVSPQLRNSDREIVAASFAVTHQKLSEWLENNRELARAGAIRTELIPALTRTTPHEFPAELYLLHYQTVSVSQAVQAVFLNALRHGFLKKDVVSRQGAWAHARERYLKRPARLRAVIETNCQVMIAIRLLALSSWSGWWMGRHRQTVDIGKRMAQLHPHESSTFPSSRSKSS